MEFFDQNISTTTNTLNQIYSARLSDKEFLLLSDFISSETGIKMPPAKRVMLQSRLYKRLKNLNMSSFKDYCEYVFSRKGYSEIDNMIDVVCTNKTSFFRESHHFDFMVNYILPSFENQRSKYFKIWSAGCSSGEEPYTIGMVLQYYNDVFKKGIDYQILGTDISTIMIDKSTKAIYDYERINEIPAEIKNRYLLKNKNNDIKNVRVSSEVRKNVKFKRMNFMDNSYDLKDKFDIIFCRNVLIYFDRTIQEKVVQKLCRHLNSRGYLFIGHSESLFSMDLPIIQIKPTIFKKK